MLQAQGVVGAIFQTLATQDGRTKARYRGAEYPAELPRVEVKFLAHPERADVVVGAHLQYTMYPAN